MRIDDYDLELAVKFLWIANPSVRRNYSDPQHFRAFIISCARQYMRELTVFSTAGFVLSNYVYNDGTIVVRVSVSAFVALKYAESMEQGNEATNNS